MARSCPGLQEQTQRGKENSTAAQQAAAISTRAGISAARGLAREKITILVPDSEICPKWEPDPISLFTTFTFPILNSCEKYFVKLFSLKTSFYKTIQKYWNKESSELQ